MMPDAQSQMDLGKCAADPVLQEETGFSILTGFTNDSSKIKFPIPPPLKKAGGLDWEKVTEIEILEVEDTHGCNRAR